MKEYYMPYTKHLEELRLRIIFSFIIFTVIGIGVYISADYFINYILSIFRKAIINNNNIFFAREVFSGFSVRIRISLYIAFIFSVPFFIYNIIRFIFPALSNKFQRVIILALVVSFFIAILATYFSLNYLIPFAIKTLTSKNFVPSSVNILLDYSTQLTLPITLTLGILIVFQIPIVLTVLMYFNIIKRKTVIYMLRPTIVAIFILSAIITPPDVITQILVALPLIILLLFSLMLSYILKFGD